MRALVLWKRFIVILVLFMLHIPCVHAAKTETKVLMHTDITPASGFTYRVIKADFADGALWITASFTAPGGQSISPDAFILMTRDQDNNPVYTDPMAAWASGGVLLSLKAPHALPAHGTQDIVWQFKDPGPEAKLVTFLYLDDPNTFYMCQFGFNRPVPTAVPSETARNLDIAPSGGIYLGDPAPSSERAKIKCLVCSSLRPGEKKCTNYDCKDGKIVKSELDYGVRVYYTESCWQCSGDGWVKCTNCDDGYYTLY